MTSLHRRLLALAETDPEGIAFEDPVHGSISRGEMIALVDAIASAAPGERKAVGVLSNRRVEAALGVLHAFYRGARFVPLNPGFPLARLAGIVAAAGVDLLMHDATTAGLAQQLGVERLDLGELIRQRDPHADLDVKALEAALPSPDAICYQMFTSGSTGEPKGVPIPYRNLAHYVESVAQVVDLPERPRCSQLFNLSFDPSLHDIFVCLYQGGTLVFPDELDLLMPRRYIEKKKLDVWHSVPMQAVMASRSLGRKPLTHWLRRGIFCGEPLPGSHVAAFRPFLEAGARLFNLYGPTEATVTVTAREIFLRDDTRPVIPLGDPFGQNFVLILTGAGEVREPAEGEEGELLLGGPQVFAGYLPDVERPAFVEHDGHRLYRSGDLVRVLQGELEHLGRIDDQVKLRGYRVELGAIEAAVRQAFGLEAVAAFLQGRGDTARLVVAYEGPASAPDPRVLATVLPAYMIPSELLHIDRLPLNSNGKVDRKQLALLVS